MILPLLVSCDPDTKRPSYAYFVRGDLQSVHMARSPRESTPYPRQALLVIEAQYMSLTGKKIGPGQYQQIRADDILSLAWAAGECSMHFDTIERVSPLVWKGNTPKDLHHGWVESELTDAEKFACGIGKRSKTQLREIFDAVGIGLWKLGRLR